MANCPICGLTERCRNHWVAVQEPSGEIEFQIGAMTASEDNLILLRNKFNNPPLRTLFEKISLAPEWVEEQGRLMAYLTWPLELRGAVNNTLFPVGSPGSERPVPPTPIFKHRLEALNLSRVELDLENCLPDEVLYKAYFDLDLAGVGTVGFEYMQLTFAEGVEWAKHFQDEAKLMQAHGIVQLMLGGIVDPLRSTFVGHDVDILADEQPKGLEAGKPVDEVAVMSETELHLGEEIEALVNQRHIQPLLRDSLLQLAIASAPSVH